jgi:hypothetical protein
LTDDEEELFDISFTDSRVVRTPKANRWAAMKVLPRARELYELKLFEAVANKKRRTGENLYSLFTIDISNFKRAQDKAQRREARADLFHQITKGAYMVVSMYIKGPTFVK